MGAPPTTVGQGMFYNCASGFTIYYSPENAAQWAPNGETTWTEPVTNGLTYNILPLPTKPQLLGAQAYTDGSKFRFAFEVDVSDLQAALVPGDTLEIGYLARSKTNYDADTSKALNSYTLPIITWTAEMDAAETGTALKDILYTAYYATGMRILEADADSMTFALILTQMTNYQDVNIVFSGYIKTSQITLRSGTKYNSITNVLAQTASVAVD